MTRNRLRSGEEYPYHDNLSVQYTGEVTKLDTGVEVVITDRTVVNWVGIIHWFTNLYAVFQSYQINKQIDTWTIVDGKGLFSVVQSTAPLIYTHTHTSVGNALSINTLVIAYAMWCHHSAMRQVAISNNRMCYCLHVTHSSLNGMNLNHNVFVC